MLLRLLAASSIFLGPLAASSCLASSQVPLATQLEAAQGAIIAGIAAERVGDIMSAHQHYQNGAGLIDDLVLKMRMSGLPLHAVPMQVY